MSKAKHAGSRFGGMQPFESFAPKHQPIRNGEIAYANPINEDERKALEAETDRSVCRIVHHNGFCCKQRAPHYYWMVFSAHDGSDVPVTLQGSFTSQSKMIETIDLYVRQKGETAHESSSD